MSWWKTAASWISGSSGSSNSSSIWGSLISGIGSAAGSYLSGKSEDKKNANDLTAITKAAEEQRKTLDYGARLEDFYKQEDKRRRRVALNSYGKYNLMADVMPTTSAPVEVPARPTV